VVLLATFDAGVVETDGVTYLRGDALVDWLRARSPRYSATQVPALADALRQLPTCVEVVALTP
jgi:hypothetical protein